MRNVKTENPSVRPSAVEEPRRRRGVAETELCHKLDLLLRTGSLLMESAADTSRILRTMKRAMAFLGLDERYIHLYVNWNVLMVNYSDELHSFTKFQRCERHGISLATIAKVSRLTWTAIREDFSLVQYEKALDDIHDAPRGFTPWQVAIGGGFACGASASSLAATGPHSLIAPWRPSWVSACGCFSPRWVATTTSPSASRPSWPRCWLGRQHSFLLIQR